MGVRLDDGVILCTMGGMKKMSFLSELYKLCFWIHGWMGADGGGVVLKYARLVTEK